MTEKTAQIQATQHEIHPTGERYTTFEWIGERHWPIYISMDIDISKLPFELVKIGVADNLFDYKYMRKDAYFPYGWIVVIKEKAYRLYMYFFYRIMATLNIWNLAYTPHGQVPSWRDIFRVKNY